MRDEVVLSSEQIQTINRRLGRQLTARLMNEEKIPVVIAVMKGALYFFADVTRQIKCPIYIDYIKVHSYIGKESSGQITLENDIHRDLEGRTVVIVEDVIDTGLTMYHLKEYLYKKYNPKQILVCALFNKRPLRQLEVDVDFVGKEINDSLFLMGYGLDYDELDRHIPYVYSAAAEDIERMEVDKKR